MVNKDMGMLANLMKQLITEQNLLKKEVLTFSEAAIYLRMSVPRLNTLTANCQITHYEPYRGRVVFLKKDLDRFLLRNKKWAFFETEQPNNKGREIE